LAAVGAVPREAIGKNQENNRSQGDYPYTLACAAEPRHGMAPVSIAGIGRRRIGCRAFAMRYVDARIPRRLRWLLHFNAASA
jgi:hypothetical protein